MNIPTTTLDRPIQIIASFKDASEVAPSDALFHLQGYQVTQAGYDEPSDPADTRLVVVIERAA